MSQTTHRCTCGATLQFRQDLLEERTGTYPTWKCKDCLTPVPGRIGEQLRHQHPS
ncbi:hypothetical protein [Natronolimnobius baerhuensis]|uniref:hypothetical protein n=1 Tax=Natronolimnobius baerhuensis TaxID=253108 RepID=UPI001595C405|nr:hypothetical protein [Natronolimnobius baerhuensis]